MGLATGSPAVAVGAGSRVGVRAGEGGEERGAFELSVSASGCVLAVHFGRLMHHRSLARDYETHPHRSEAMIHVAMIDLISRRLTRENTLNWRDP